jgi:hypothetical protein
MQSFEPEGSELFAYHNEPKSAYSIDYKPRCTKEEGEICEKKILYVKEARRKFDEDTIYTISADLMDSLKDDKDIKGMIE